MELIETRDLDGPNYFAPYPVIKLEVRIDAHAAGGGSAAGNQVAALSAAVASLFRELDEPVPEIFSVQLDDPAHFAILFPWQWRESALLIAKMAFDRVRGSSDVPSIETLRARLEEDRRTNDVPLWVRDDQRRIPAVGITATNGKTTTTRLVAHIARTAGKHVGWSSSTGVYIDGEQVIDGDYTGPSGARRVLNDPSVDIAVLETARGGILLRGLAYESNDVGVFLNVSPDHLDLQGVRTVETLAEVKGIVVRVTRPDGLVVLNADDPLVLAQRSRVRAPVLLFSQHPDSTTIAEHERAGGKTLVRDGDDIIYFDGATRSRVISVREVPMSFGGIARHMVENALGGLGAGIGLGLDMSVLREALRTFRSDTRSNVGRLNVFRLDGRIVVIDYAHNESGLEELTTFTRALMGNSGRLATIIGTAGDRQDVALRRLGEIAAERADAIYLKENPKYLRGREPGEQVAQMLAGVEAARGDAKLAGSFPGELDALNAAIERTSAGDAIAVMCVEEQLMILRELRDRGAEEWS